MTRGVAIAVMLTCAAASAAGGARGKRSKAPATRAAPPAETKRSGEPARREEPAPPASAKAGERASENAAGLELRYTLGIGGGGFFAGGANRGPSVMAQVTALPNLAEGRFALDLELGWRLGAFTTSVERYGALTSSAHSVPLTPALRFRAFRAGLLTLDVRGGVGLLVVVHHLSSDFAPSATRSGVGWEAFAGTQVRVPVSKVELFLDLRFALGEAPVPFVLGRATGAQALLGVRYDL